MQPLKGFLKPNTEFGYKGKVSNFFKYKGTIFINDSIKLGTSLRLINTNKFPIYYSGEVQIGDSIVIEPFNDTLYIYSNSTKVRKYKIY